MKQKIYCVTDTTEFLHPFKIAFFIYKPDAEDFLKMIKKRLGDTFILEEIEREDN